ncbi:MAG: type VI secretion system-associated protein TagO [Glycocaulis sp.]
MELFWVIALGLYFLPAFVAAGRQHHDAGAVFVLNLLLGWTLLGWVIALVWSLTAVRTPAGKTDGAEQGSPPASPPPGSGSGAERAKPVELPLIGVLPGWALPVAGLGFLILIFAVLLAVGLWPQGERPAGSAGGVDRAALAERGQLSPACNEALSASALHREITGGTALRVINARPHDDDRLIACTLAERHGEAQMDYVLLAWREPFGPAGQQTRFAGFEGADGERLADGPSMEDLRTALAERRAAEAEARRGQHWRTSSSRSEMTDFTNHYLWTGAQGALRDRYGRSISPSLQVRCQENVTSVYLLADEFLSTQPVQVEYRIDDGPVRTARWAVSTDYQAAGQWRGAGAIPFLRQLVDARAERLTLRYTPHGSSPRTVSFDVSGIDRRIAPVRRACGW